MFSFMGPSPIDFDTKIQGDVCVWPELCKLNMKEQYDKGIRKIGIVFNLDKHTQGGSHWVALYVDLSEKYIYYFDSCGVKKPPKEITVIMTRIIQQCKTIGIGLRTFINSMSHQKGNTECGMYVLYFIICLLNGIKKPEEYSQRRIPDEEVEMFRDIFFNKLED